MANSMVITVFISFDFVYIPVFIYFSCQSIQFQEGVNETVSVNFNDNEYASWDFENDEFDLSKASFHINNDQVAPTTKWLDENAPYFESQ